MTDERVQRRLAAILAADIVGYSRLMAADEVRTLAGLRTLRAEAVDPIIAEHQGRIVKEMGDGLLIEFASVVDAVQCALALQKSVSAIEETVPEERRIVFRIGVNLGDIIIQGEDIFGDGVNIAARLEALAKPGEIYVSAAAAQQVRGKIPVSFVDLGAKTLKNIPEPVQVFRVRAGSAESQVMRRSARSHRRPVVALAYVAAFGILIAGTALYLRINDESGSMPTDDAAPAATELPSVAVLPFENLSNDADQDWFADGVTTDIITDLSKVSGLFVVARDSSFAYRDRKEDVRAAGRELGVNFLLEGSVRRAGNKLRISAQLLDVSTGSYLWAERFDESIGEVFALQDRVARSVADVLSVELSGAEEQAIGQIETSEPAAYEAFIRGREHFRRQTPDDFADARDFFEQAVALDPNYSRAQAALAQVYHRSFEFGWSRSLGIGWNVARLRAGNYLAKAWENPTSLTHRVASEIYLRSGRTADALMQAQTALQLEPHDPANLVSLASAQIFSGRPADALSLIQKAMRADPQFPANYLYLQGLALFTAERFEEAARALEDALRRNPALYRARGLLAATYAVLGRNEEAKRNFEAFAEANPRNSVYGEMSGNSVWASWPFKDRADWSRLAEALSAAGGRELYDSPLHEAYPLRRE